MSHSRHLNLDQWKTTVLLHNGAAHSLTNVLSQAIASNVEISVDLDQVGPVAGDDVPANLFLIQPHNPETYELPLVLYKYQGRFHVLTGNAHVARARTNKQIQVKGLLLSTPALKKARIVKDEEVAPPPTTAPARPFRPESRPARYVSYGGARRDTKY